jgi:hypothetical protein
MSHTGFLPGIAGFDYDGPHDIGVAMAFRYQSYLDMLDAKESTAAHRGRPTAAEQRSEVLEEFNL